MDSSDEDTLMILVLLRKRRKRRKRSLWSREHFLLRDTRGEYARTFCSLKEKRDDEFFLNYLRMSYRTYDELKSLVLPFLQPIGSNWRQLPISAEEKLVLTLRHLATGGSFASMSVPFHMAANTISEHVFATCNVIWDVLQPLELPTPTQEKWLHIAKKYGDLWDFPFAIGALDGKHIALKNPMNSDSQFYNYKGFPSIVLMALSDADSCFTLVDCGQYGRISDAGVFNASRLSTLLEQGMLNIPEVTFKISNSDIDIPCMILGDEAFPLKSYLMKPFASRTLNPTRRIYNYRHSRARRSVECAFGILAVKFEIFQRPMRVEPDKACIITKSAVALHNFIRKRDGKVMDSACTITYETRDNATRDGLQSLALNSNQGRASEQAMNIREALSIFFAIQMAQWNGKTKLFLETYKTE